MRSAINHRPRLCIVGPMVGRNPNRVTTQGERLADLFSAAGYPTISVSSSANRYVRAADIIQTIIRQRRQIDILVLQVFSGPSFVVEDIASQLGKRLGLKIVMVLRGGGMPTFAARFPAWTRRVLKRADVLITPSQYLARAVKPYGFCARVIPNIINLAEYTYRERKTLKPHLLWMRAFHPIYNPAMALRAFARLRARRPEATLVMAGQDNGYESGIRTMAEKMGLNSAVRFSGFLNPDGKRREWEKADIFINTNRIDNMPVSVVEACAIGLPVVSTAVGGVPDLLTHGETGLLVPDEDDESMAEAICHLLEDQRLAQRLSVNGRRVAERSSWDSVKVQWEEVFGEVMSAR